MCTCSHCSVIEISTYKPTYVRTYILLYSTSLLSIQVHLLHDQIREDKKKREEYLKLATSFDGEIKQMRDMMDHSVHPVSSDHSETGGAVRRDLQPHGSTTADYKIMSPRTSTPSKTTSSRSFLHLSPHRSPLRLNKTEQL